MKTVTVVAGYGQYHCGECGTLLTLEPIEGGGLIETNTHAVAACRTWGSDGCSRFGLRLNIPLVHLQAEVLEGESP